MSLSYSDTCFEDGSKINVCLFEQRNRGDFNYWATYREYTTKDRLENVLKCKVRQHCYKTDIRSNLLHRHVSGNCFHFLLILCFSYNLFLSFLLLSLSSTGLSQAQSGGVAARLKLTRNMTVSSNPSSNLPPSFTWPNKSKCMMVLSSTLSYSSYCMCCLGTAGLHNQNVTDSWP
jgi:hypothetical protein